MIISSVLQIGDSSYVNSLTRALAVQREAEVYLGNEGDFSQYPVYSEPIPLPPITEEVVFQKVDYSPCIQVANINIIAASSAAVVHIGSTKHVYMESRLKHIRQLFSSE